MFGEHVWSDSMEKVMDSVTFCQLESPFGKRFNGILKLIDME